MAFTLFPTQFVVTGVSKDSPAELSRISFKDEICMYMMAAQDMFQDIHLVHDKSPTSMHWDLEKAYRGGKNVIVFIHRSGKVTRV